LRIEEKESPGSPIQLANQRTEPATPASRNALATEEPFLATLRVRPTPPQDEFTASHCRLETTDRRGQSENSGTPPGPNSGCARRLFDRVSPYRKTANLARPSLALPENGERWLDRVSPYRRTANAGSTESRPTGERRTLARQSLALPENGERWLDRVSPYRKSGNAGSAESRPTGNPGTLARQSLALPENGEGRTANAGSTESRPTGKRGSPAPSIARKCKRRVAFLPPAFAMIT